MYARARYFLTALAVLLFSVSVAGAQQYGQGRPVFAQQQLDQMLAPIALYPDALLSQVLMAATYPGEVVEAARWSRRNPDLNGDRAVRAVERIDWDPSVKSLVAFPQILDMLDQKPNWTEDLGDAFLNQQAQVMDTIQYLRRQAHSAGNLSSSDQFRVDVQDSTFSINFVNPEMVYLPYYNPTVVYGTWWWPAYQPVYWAPWHGYHARPGYARGFAWGPAIPVSRGFFFGAPDWHRRCVNIVNVNNYYYRPAYRPLEVTRNAAVPAAPNAWQHDGMHRRDVPYRDAALLQPAARVGAAPEARHDARDRETFFVNGRSVAGNVAAPLVIAPPATRSAPVNQPAAPVAAENIPRATQSRGAETRVDGGNRAAERGNHQQIAVVAPAAVASQPEMRTAPARVPQPAAQAHVQPAPARPVAEQRPAVAAAEGGARRADARPANGREQRANHPAPADNTAAASGNTASAQDSGRNSRRQ